MGDWFSSVFENLFGFLFNWFKWIVNSTVNGIGSFFEELFTVITDIGSFIVNGILDGVTGLFNFIAEVIYSMGQGIIDAIKFLFSPFIKFFDGFWYFLVQALSVIVWVLKVILGLIGVVFSVIGGFFNTIFSFLNWSGSATPVQSVYSDGFNFFLTAFNNLGGSVFAGVLAALLWILTIFILFKMLSRA